MSVAWIALCSFYTKCFSTNHQILNCKYIFSKKKKKKILNWFPTSNVVYNIYCYNIYSKPNKPPDITPQNSRHRNNRDIKEMTLFHNFEMDSLQYQLTLRKWHHVLHLTNLNPQLLNPNPLRASQSTPVNWNLNPFIFLLPSSFRETLGVRLKKKGVKKK